MITVSILLSACPWPDEKHKHIGAKITLWHVQWTRARKHGEFVGGGVRKDGGKKEKEIKSKHLSTYLAIQLFD